MNTFKVNNYISLSFEANETTVMVNNHEFIQCKSILITIPAEKSYESDRINSIDQMVDAFKWSEATQKAIKCRLSPEEEFWAHCSNLQGWFEHEYDTRLLHSNIAFPLLKKLCKLGDPLATKVFKEEIAKRLAENYPPINELFIEENYLNFLSMEELGSCCPQKLNVDRLILSSRRLIDIPPLIETLPIHGLKSLNLINNRFTVFPSFILKNRDLEVLLLRENQIECIPDSIDNLTRLKKLDLSNNQLKALPNNIGKLESLNILNLYDNNLMTIPDSIGSLTSLKKLVLTSNRLQRLPESIGNLTDLEQLSLRSNELSSLPSTLVNLKNLKSLDLSNNRFHDSSAKEFVRILSLRVARNNAHSMIQNAEKLLNKNNSVTFEQKSKILENIKELKKSMKSDNLEEIELKTHDLSSF